MGSAQFHLDASPLIEFAERTGRKPAGQTSWARAWHRMRKTGTVTIGVADRFCIEALGWSSAA